jgi:hypothetical protein
MKPHFCSSFITDQIWKRHQKYTPEGKTSAENNRCVKLDMVDKGHNKKPEKDYIYQYG